MSGEEGAAGARNVSGKVNETFKVVRNSSTPDRSLIRFYCILIVLSDRSNYLKKKKQLRSKNSFFSNSRNSNSILRDS